MKKVLFFMCLSFSVKVSGQLVYPKGADVYTDHLLELRINDSISQGATGLYFDSFTHKRSNDTLGILQKKKSHRNVITISPLVDVTEAYDFGDKENRIMYGAGLKLWASDSNRWFVRGLWEYSRLQVSDKEFQMVNNTHSLPGVSFARTRNGGVDVNDFKLLLGYRVGKYIHFTAGLNNLHLGDGYRSLLFSSQSATYPFFRTDVRFWKLHYMSQFALLHHESPYDAGFKSNRKYAAMHLLSWDITKRFNFHVFETIIWKHDDGINYRGFEVNYLNPVVFYRPVEFSVGSPDNSTLGFGFHYLIMKKTSFYGQAFIDDLIIGEFRNDLKHLIKPDDRSIKWGYWTTKTALQLGLKSADVFGVKGLFSRIEYNQIRPYTYSHRNPIQNFSNKGLPLAHPFGSNLKEGLCQVFYLHDKWLFEGFGNVIFQGIDNSSSEHFGSDIFKSTYDTYDSIQKNVVIKQYENKILQGKLCRTLSAKALVSYFLHQQTGLRIELGAQLYQSNFNGNQSGIMFLLGIRTGMLEGFRERLR